MTAGSSTPATLDFDADRSQVRVGGHWVTAELGAAVDAVQSLAADTVRAEVIEADELAALDTAGAWLLLELEQRLTVDGKAPSVVGLGDAQAELLAFVREHDEGEDVPPAEPALNPIARLGIFMAEGTAKSVALLSFLGQTALAFAAVVARPHRLRWPALFVVIQRAGVQAIPIVALLTLLLGVVIAYQGGLQLSTYGANIFVVELVALTMTRELAPIMTAIIVAGRTGSAFTAELGTMKASEEIDALRTIGLDPIDVLVLPRLLGLVIALPLLTLIGDAAGILGGMIMAATMLGISFADFFARLPEAMTATSFMIGIGKAPVFAMLIAIVGCFEGFAVRGGAEAVGLHTTVSVVHGIFLVIVADAVFSVIFSWLGI
ncbi:MAG: ABC transporter permease [Gammaproteobacteria bacterium]